MKTKFERMTWEEKKQAINDYANSKENRKEVVKRTKRAGIIGGIGAIYTIGLTIYNLVTDAAWYELLISVAFLIGCVILMKASYNILSTQVNNYVVSNLKGKAKADYRKGLDQENKKKEKKKNK